MSTLSPELQAYAKQYGTVDFEGKRYYLTQQAYADNYGTDGAVRYYAHAVDAEGNSYTVAWDTTGEWDARETAYKRWCHLDSIRRQSDDLSDDETAELEQLEADNADMPQEDESDACDWDKPVEVKADI